MIDENINGKTNGKMNEKGNDNVIEFPKAQTMKKSVQSKVQEQKSMLILSIASVLILAVFMNQWLVTSPQALETSGNRQLASFGPAAFAKDVQWEHDLARKMASDQSSIQSSLAEAPTLRDELIFGFLEGKYGMKLSEGKITSLEFIDAQAGEQPMEISDKSSFLNKYSQAFGLSYSQVALSSAHDEMVYSLIDDAKQIVATAHFTMDDQGRVAAIHFNK